MTLEEYFKIQAKIEHIQLVLWRNGKENEVSELGKILFIAFKEMDSHGVDEINNLINPYKVKSDKLESQGK